jgi:hypothetical protein
MATATAEEKIQKLVEFALAFKDDPDFNRIPLPAPVLARLAELGIKQEKKQYSATQAVDKAFAITSEYAHQYTSNEVQVIDQTSLSISFPPIPETAPPTSTNETKNQESEGHSNLLVTDADSNIVLSEKGLCE